MEISGNVHGACRLCLHGEGKISLFHEENGQCSITAKSIYDCVSVKITKEDKLPKGICENCLCSVESWCTFKDICDKTQETLVGWLNCNGQLGSISEEGKVSSLKDFMCDNETHENENSFLTPSDLLKKKAPEIGASSSSPLKPLKEIPAEEVSSTLHGEEENKQFAIVSSTKEIEDSPQSNSISENDMCCDPANNNSREIEDVESQRVPEDIAIGSESAVCDGDEKGKSSDCASEPMEISSNAETTATIANGCDELSCSGIVEESLSSIVQATVEAVKSIALLSSQSGNDSACANKVKSSETINELINPGTSNSESTIKSVNSSETSKFLDMRLNLSSQSAGESSTEVVSSVHIDSTSKITSNEETGNILTEEEVLPDTTVVPDSKETQGTRNESSTDSDKENFIPYSETSIAEGSKEQHMKVSETGDHSSESEQNISFPGIRIESISTLIPETTDFFSSQDGKQNIESDHFSEIVNKTTVVAINQSCEPVPADETTMSEANINPAEERSKETMELSNIPSSDQDSVMEIDRTETNSEETLEDQRSTPEADRDHNFSQAMVQNIKLEPIDTHEVPPIVHENNIFPIRIKSEFSSIDYEDNEYALGEPSVSGEETNKCDICNRKYSSVSNYLKHLQTKVHMYNASLDPEENNLRIANENAAAAGNHYLADARLNYDSYSEDSMLSAYSSDSPMLRSRLCPEEFVPPPPTRLINLNQIRQAKPKVPYPSSLSKLPKRKERCKLCNTSFTYISEMRRHLLSRKHKDNEQLMRDNEFMMRENKRMIRDSERMFREKQRYMRERSLMYAQNEEISGPLSEKNQQFMCPIENCHYSCNKGLRLLAHMKTHGIGQPSAPLSPQLPKEYDSMTPKPKLSLRQQELLKKELEKRKALSEAEAAVPEPEIHDYRCDGCSKTFLRESGLKKHSYYCAAVLAAQQQEQDEEEEVEVDEYDDEVEEEEEPKMPENVSDTLQMRKMHCPICNLTFAAKSVFISHVQIYHKGSTLESGLFRPKKTSNKLQITSNKLRVQNKKGHSYVCNHCDKKFNLLSSLNYHLKIHTTKHICKICKKGYDSRRAFMDHCRLHFLPPGSKQTLCHKCFRVFKTRAEFYFHRKNDMCSIKLKIYSCNFCEHSFKDLSALEEHKRRIHGNVLDEDGNSEEDVTPAVDNSVRQSMQNYLSMNRQSFETADENRPGTSSKLLPTNVPIPSSNHQSAKTDPFLHCDVCDRDYATLASLKKHMWKYHQTKPVLNRKLDLARKNSVLQGGIAKCWKCKHCKKVCKTRRLLVVHLKKCKYNAYDLGHGMCLQCGKWFESGKARICSFCLPNIPKFKKSLPEPSSYLLTPKVELSLVPKQEVNSAPARIPNHSLQGSAVKPAKVAPLSSGGIRLMKCPVGSKYFRSELLMIKHYSQCDGTCENRCSHCRKLFNSSKEYRTHLWNSKCYGYNRSKSSRPSLPLVNNDMTGHSESEYSELESFSLKQNDGSEVSGSGEVSAVESCLSEESSVLDIDGGLANDPTSKINEEKSFKIGRICTLCDKVVSMQRGLYRHVYACFKLCMLNQESVSCRKCNRTFSKHLSMKENTTAIRQHILECYYIPFYEGQGLLEDGSPSEVPPPFLCYVCSFGFSSNECLRRHIMEHRSRKDEVNNIVLLLEAEMLSERRLNSDTVSYNIQIQPESCETLTSQPQRKKNVLSFKVPGMISASPSRKIIRKKLLECEKCSRKFTNRNKFLRHKKVHGIVTQSVFHEVSENYLDYIADHSAPSND